jgi:Arc/MetJ-type ribon-helix-helix transcriptional regulator
MAGKLVTVKLPVYMIKLIDNIVKKASSPRADFIRHAIRYCFENRVCIDSYLTPPSDDVGVREIDERRSKIIKRVEVIGVKTYGYSG